jgi:hypothetical protein
MDRRELSCKLLAAIIDDETGGRKHYVPDGISGDNCLGIQLLGHILNT